MTNNLPPDLAAFVAEQVASGKYASIDDAILDAVRKCQDSERRAAELRRMLQDAIDELDRGEGIVCESDADLDLFFEDIKQRGRARLAKERASAS